MDLIFYLVIGIIVMAIVFSMAVGYRIYQDEKTKETAIASQLNYLAQLTKENNSQIKMLADEITSFRSNDTTSSGNEHLSQEIVALLSLIVEKLDAKDSAQFSSTENRPQNAPSQLDDHSVFQHAIRLAKEHKTPEEIVNICGIQLSEAQLVVQMHSQTN